jgi:hypothetical protein
MAPEISTGNYGKGIDVYACGILLYEMLTGRVPFDGESAGEILMKHLTCTPDLSALPFEFVPIVSKALAKSPAQRYAGLAEMAQAVEALNAPPPQAPQLAPRESRGANLPPPLPPRRQPPDAVPMVTPAPPLSFRGQVGELSGSMFLAVVLSLLATLPWVSLLRWEDRGLLGSLFFATVAVSWAVLVPTKFWGPANPGDGWGRRICLAALGMVIGLGAMWLDGWHPELLIPANSVGVSRLDEHERTAALTAAAGYVSYFGLSLGAVRWWRMTDRRRKSWFSLFHVLAAGFAALLLGLVFWPSSKPMFGAAALVMASAIVQWVSPWEPPPPPPPKRLRLRYA